MSLDNEDAIAKAIGETSLENLPEPKVRELVDHFDEIPDELQLQLLKSNPALQKYALDAITAVEDDLKATLSSIDASSQQAFAALAEIREVLAGELNKEDISDERWRFLIEKLSENGKIAVAVDSETKQLIAQQANAARLSKVAVAAMPYIDTVVQVGVRLLLTRGKL
jgi:hypothetical protein